LLDTSKNLKETSSNLYIPILQSHISDRKVGDSKFRNPDLEARSAEIQAEFDRILA
jgi:hypothetical protein